MGNFAEKDRFDFLFTGLESVKGNVVVNILGSGRNKTNVLKAFDEQGIAFHDHGQCPHEKLPEVLRRMDIGFIFRDEDVGESIPVALYEFASMNIPTICNNAGLMAEFVREQNIGYVIDDAAEFGAVINEILEAPQQLRKFQSLHDLACSSFSRQAESAKFEALICSALEFPDL